MLHAPLTPRHPLLMPLPLTLSGRCRSLFYTAWEEADALGLIDATGAAGGRDSRETPEYATHCGSFYKLRNNTESVISSVTGSSSQHIRNGLRKQLRSC